MDKGIFMKKFGIRQSLEMEEIWDGKEKRLMGREV